MSLLKTEFSLAHNRKIKEILGMTGIPQEKVLLNFEIKGIMGQGLENSL